jgi:hypothetical protein
MDDLSRGSLGTQDALNIAEAGSTEAAIDPI